MTNRGEADERNTAISGPGVRLTAINGYVVAASYKARRELFGERFESAVMGRYPARTKNCEAGQLSGAVTAPEPRAFAPDGLPVHTRTISQYIRRPRAVFP